MTRAKDLLPLGLAIAVSLFAVLIVAGCGYVNAASKPDARFNRHADSLILGLQQFKEFTGAYPIGSNVYIAKALLGQTDKKVLILAVRQNDLNDKGEIVDPWGTPFRFYFSGDEVLIRSAGPNRVWEDDATPAADDLYRSNLTGRKQ
jgi:hypothetical protein